MIPSTGNNRFKDNLFDYWSWSAPVLQTHEEVVAALREMRLVGRTIRDIRTVGRAEDWTDELDEGWTPDHATPLPKSLWLDEPLLLLFADGDILGIDFSEGSCLRMELNTLPWELNSAYPGPKEYYCQRFGRVVGRQVIDVDITSSMVSPDFTGSHDLFLPEQPAYLQALALILSGDVPDEGPQQLSLRFESDFDYCCVTLSDDSP
ncbi:MAG: hypothetical protein ACI4WT_14385 [Oligosphaeraceae bacterium]